MLAIRSRLLTQHGFAHAFATRTGGEDSASLLAAAGAQGGSSVYQVTQVHGAAAVVVRAGASVDDVRATEADALIAREHGMAVGVRTADCVPILLADPESGACAAVHAGWRGAVAGVLPVAVERLCEGGVRAARLVAAIGPHIRVDAFEIGEEVAAELVRAAAGSEDVVNRDREKPYGDLAALLRKQLRSAGIPDGRIDDVGGCTFSDSERFYSYRRQPGETGRQLSLIESCANRMTP